MQRILVTGAAGQIGSELTAALRERYGAQNVVAADIRENRSAKLMEGGPFEHVDVTQREQIEAAVIEYRVDTIFHMAAILSAVGEEKPQLAWRVNMTGLLNVLEVAREHNLLRVFSPSSIAVFGPETPPDPAPQAPPLRPTTIYGVTKVAGELLGEYYVHRFGLDVRGVRYPGIISSETLPGGGTTDYAVEIFYKALQEGHLLQGSAGGALHLFCAGGYSPANDVHARLHQGNYGPDGGRWHAPNPPLRLQPGGDELLRR